MTEPLALPASLAAWNTDGFRVTLCREVEALGPHRLPLQQGLAHSSAVGTAPLRIMVISESAAGNALFVRVGVFYTGVIAGCNCADDPTPVDEQNEYCILQIEIDRATAAIRVSLLPD